MSLLSTLNHRVHGTFLPHAYLAVDFFFMLSGFIVARAYEARLSTSMTFVEFVKVRFVRLYPIILIIREHAEHYGVTPPGTDGTS